MRQAAKIGRMIGVLGLLVLLAGVVNAAETKFYWATCRTGGGDCLDGIDGAALAAGDSAIVSMDAGTTTPTIYFYRGYASSAAASDPSVVAPAANAGTFRWHLSNVYAQSVNSVGADGTYGAKFLNNTTAWALAAGEYGFGFAAGVPQIGVNGSKYTILASNSYAGAKEVGWTIFESDADTATGDGKKAYVVPTSLNGMNLVDLTCSVYNLNSASGGTTTVVLRRSRAGTDVNMTSTGVTISYDAYTASDETIDTSNDDVATGDLLFVDVDAVTTGAVQKGLSCTALFRLP